MILAEKTRFWPSFISPLSARILAIMLFPLALFFIGLFSIDQYRSVLVQAEFEALERQGRILARSLALEDARERPFGLRGLAPTDDASSIAFGRLWYTASRTCLSALGSNYG